MKQSALILFCFLFLQLVYSQQEMENKQMMIGIDNVSPTTEVDHTAEAVGTYWEYDDGDWIVSSDPDGESSTITTVGESNFNDLTNWDGWCFFWLSTTPDNEPWGMGFYKVTNDYTSTYFYVDCRVDAFGENGTGYNPPNFWVYVDGSDGDYFYDDESSPTWNPVSDNGAIIRVWDVFSVSAPSSNSLEDFWDNALVAALDESNHPRIAWGPYPSSIGVTGYRIYRKIGGAAWGVLVNNTGNIYEYTDETLTLANPGGEEGTTVYYYVKGLYYEETLIETGATNTVSFQIRGEDPGKRSGITNNETINTYALNQNYPNPFNPATVISFSVAKNTYASLKVYDVLGNEVAVLMNSVIEAGDHSVEFNASDLPSGIYIYQLQAGGYTQIREMVLLR